jgi:hypothetical protein
LALVDGSGVRVTSGWWPGSGPVPTMTLVFMLSKSFMRTPDDSGGKFTLGFAAGSHNLVVDNDYS